MRAQLTLPFLLLLAAGCGFVSAISSQSLRVEAVATGTPQPALAACLTRELRLALASRQSARDSSNLRLVTEIVSFASRPGTLARVDGRLRSIDVSNELRVRARIVDRRGGATRWGPILYRLEERAVPGTSALTTRANVETATARACQEIVQRLVEDISFFLVDLENAQEDRWPDAR